MIKKLFNFIFHSVTYSCVITIVLMIAGELTWAFTGGNILAKYFYHTDAQKTVVMYLDFIGFWIFYLLVMLVFKPDRFMLKKLSTKTKGNNLKMLTVGLLIGFGMNMACIVAAMLNRDIHVYFDGISPLMFVLIFIAVFVQSSAEELICRCFLYEKISRYHLPVTAIVVNSLVFAAMHLFNSGITVIAFVDIMLSGLIFSVMVYYFDSIWAAFAIHAAWNFTQNIIMGLPNSGMVAIYSMFKLDTASAQSSFFYDVGFGVEGTWFAVIVETLTLIVLIYLGRKKKHGEFTKPEITA